MPFPWFKPPSSWTAARSIRSAATGATVWLPDRLGSHIITWLAFSIPSVSFGGWAWDHSEADAAHLHQGFPMHIVSAHCIVC